MSGCASSTTRGQRMQSSDNDVRAMCSLAVGRASARNVLLCGCVPIGAHLRSCCASCCAWAANRPSSSCTGGRPSSSPSFIKSAEDEMDVIVKF